MKIAAAATALVLTLGGALAEAAVTLPKPASVMGGNSQNVQLHTYVVKNSKYTAPEWGLRKASLQTVPIQIHPYVTGRFGF
jgi:hypothetical protein